MAVRHQTLKIHIYIWINSIKNQTKTIRERDRTFDGSSKNTTQHQNVSTKSRDIKKYKKSSTEVELQERRKKCREREREHNTFSK